MNEDIERLQQAAADLQGFAMERVDRLYAEHPVATIATLAILAAVAFLRALVR